MKVMDVALKPLKAEALQYDGENIKELTDFGAPVIMVHNRRVVMINGEQTPLDDGDVVIKSPHGQLAIFSAEKFATTFDVADKEALTTSLSGCQLALAMMVSRYGEQIVTVVDAQLVSGMLLLEGRHVVDGAHVGSVFKLANREEYERGQKR